MSLARFSLLKLVVLLILQVVAFYAGVSTGFLASSSLSSSSSSSTMKGTRDLSRNPKWEVVEDKSPVSAIRRLRKRGTIPPRRMVASDMLPGDDSYAKPVKVAFQGESGAYSEKSARELLGPRITTVAYESFDATFRAVASREVDYACIPIENSLGGSIHSNYDLLLRYDLHIIGEHEFKVEHCLLALPGADKKDIKKVMSHPQALAQCDTYLRTLGINLAHSSLHPLFFHISFLTVHHPTTSYRF
jgi:hypothetical protein